MGGRGNLEAVHLFPDLCNIVACITTFYIGLMSRLPHSRVGEPGNEVHFILQVANSVADWECGTFYQSVFSLETSLD